MLKSKALALAAVGAFIAVAASPAFAETTGTTSIFTNSWMTGCTNVSQVNHDYYDGYVNNWTSSEKAGVSFNGISGNFTKSSDSGDINGAITGTIKNPPTNSGIDVFGNDIPKDVVKIENPGSTSDFNGNLAGTYSGQSQSFKLNFDNPSIEVTYDSAGSYTHVHVYGNDTAYTNTHEEFGSSTTSIESQAFSNFQ